MGEISRSAITKIVKGVDPSIRIAANAKDELLRTVEDYAKRLADLAISITRNANRTTILDQDVITAKEQVLKGLAFHQNQRAVRTASFDQVRQPLYQSSVGRHRPYRRWLEPMVQAMEQG